MLFYPTRAFRALLWRNTIYRRRRRLASLIEFFLPTFCIFILYIIKYDLESDPNSSSLGATVIPNYYPTNDDVIIPFSFHDYVTALRAERVCMDNPAPPLIQLLFGLPSRVISGIQSSDWPVPFVYCSSYKCREDGEDARPYCTYRTLALAPMTGNHDNPDNNSGYERMQRFKRYIEDKYFQFKNTNNSNLLLPFDYDFIQVFESNEELQSYVTSDTYGEWVDGVYQPKVAIAVVFDDGKDDKSYDYTIRVNSTNYNSEEQSAQPAAKSTPPTNRIFNPYNRQDSDSCASSTSGTPNMGKYGQSCTGQYVLNGAISIQRLVDDWILQDSGVTNVTVARNGAVFLPFPRKEYVQSGFYQNIAPFAPLLFTLGLLYPVASTIRSIVLEKELRQKELMKMMSVTECDIGWSWFTSFYSFFCLSGVLSAVCTNLLYPSSSFAVLFVFWQLTFIACIVYCFLIAAISLKATRATLIGIMLFFVGYFLPFIVDYQTGNGVLIKFLSLHPVTAYSYGLILMGYLEDSGIGVQFTNAASSDFPSEYTFLTSLVMLAGDCFLWGFVTWYLNRILPGDFGTPLRWNFPFTKQYWFKPKYFDDNDEGVDSDDDSLCVLEPIPDAVKNNYKKSSIYIHNLHKQYGDKTAVKNLTVSMYSDQITCLLGHNGAGKTTTIGMLTGMVPATSGYAMVGGYDIRTDMSTLRKNVGVCLQHDCLFPQLTVKEHIQFFSRIKGGSNATKTRDEIEHSVMSSLEAVDLAEKSNTYSKNLSGGMKRKLSVAIAFCGDSKVVFLDEPTSGMDPFSRRFTWDVIRRYRTNRCIVLTTHFMDEADLLADRIAIMSKGQLKCCGSALFLKRHYGVGYHLTIIKKGAQLRNNNGNDEEQGEMITYNEKSEAELDKELESVVHDAVPKAILISNAGTELSYQLPLGDSYRFPKMFEELDNLAKQFAIDSYGISVTTLDEVFQIVAREEDNTDDNNSDAIKVDATLDNGGIASKRFIAAANEKVFKRHVQALFAKRAKNFKRDKKAWCCSTILPTVISLLGFVVVKYTTSQNPNYPPLTLSLDRNNIGIQDDRNPIPYNSPGSYKCQPGKCIYEVVSAGNPVLLGDTSELYYYCGGNAKLPKDDSCSIQNSSTIIDEITQYGAFGVPSDDVSDAYMTSLSVYETSTAFKASQYGGIFFTHDNNSTLVSSNTSTYNMAVIQSCESKTGNYSSTEQCSDFSGIGYIVNYNFTSLHSSLLYQAVADEAILRDSLNDPDYEINFSIWPLPITKVEEGYTLAQNSFSAWFLLVLSFPFIAGSFATFIVSERESKAKHLQTVAGVKPSAYWLSTYMWDIINYQLPLWITVILMYSLDVEAFITAERKIAQSTFALLILFGPAACGFTYLLSFLFKSPSFCNLFVIVFNFFIGMAGPIVCLILRLLAVDPAQPKPHLKTAAVILEWTLRSVPSFCLGRGLLFCINISFFEIIEGKSLTAWSPTIALYDVILLGVESIIYIAATIQIDILSTRPRAVNTFYRIIKCMCIRRGNKQASLRDNENNYDDIDVLTEKDRVTSGQADNDLIVLKDLSKTYPDGKVAVDCLSFAVPNGQCFGLLGVNGAGKTTTMSMLTAEFPPSSGDALLSQFSVSNEPEQTRRTIGYCPQFDAHFMNMTGREHIELYAVIKGIPRDLMADVIKGKLAEVGLSEYDGKRLSSEYSGGMKRKLSVACATIGQPQIVFLDEPSTGMDPLARRDLWKVISRMVQGSSDMADSEKTAVILTTHSMEECEALCQRIGIMAGGKLKCLGSAQHLKNRFGKGYQLELKLQHVSLEHVDLRDAAAKIHFSIKTKRGSIGLDLEQSTVDFASVRLDSEEVKNACDYLDVPQIIQEKNLRGFSLYKQADSPDGVGLDELATLCTEELRVGSLIQFVESSYPSAVLRERQDVKLRFEISSDGVTISSLFANLEACKNQFMIEDYGVSQTSLEQVFNFHAAQAHEHVTDGNNIDDNVNVSDMDDTHKDPFGDQVQSGNVLEINEPAPKAIHIDDLSDEDSEAGTRPKAAAAFALWNGVTNRFPQLRRSLTHNTSQNTAENNKPAVGAKSSKEQHPVFVPVSIDPASKLENESAPKNIRGMEGSLKSSGNAEFKKMSKEKQDTEDNLFALQDEHVWTSTRLLSAQKELSESKAAYETRLSIERLKSEHAMEMLETEKADAHAKTRELEAVLDRTIQDYETKITNIQSQKEDVEEKLVTLQDEHIGNVSKLSLLQNELSASTSAYESRICIEQQKAGHHMELLEEDRAKTEAIVSQLQADIDTIKHDYEGKINDLKCVKDELENEHNLIRQELASTQSKLLAKEDAISRLQQQMKSLENELEYLRANRNQPIPTPTASTSQTNQNSTSGGTSVDSDAVAVGLRGMHNHINNDIRRQQQDGTVTVLFTGQSEFVNMDAFDASSFTSSCSSTSYVA